MEIHAKLIEFDGNGFDEIEKNGFILLEKRKYGSLYSLTPLLEKNKGILEEMEKNIG